MQTDNLERHIANLELKLVHKEAIDHRANALKIRGKNGVALIRRGTGR